MKKHLQKHFGGFYDKGKSKRNLVEFKEGFNLLWRLGQGQAWSVSILQPLCSYG